MEFCRHNNYFKSNDFVAYDRFLDLEISQCSFYSKRQAYCFFINPTWSKLEFTFGYLCDEIYLFLIMDYVP